MGDAPSAAHSPPKLPDVDEAVPCRNTSTGPAPSSEPTVCSVSGFCSTHR